MSAAVSLIEEFNSFFTDNILCFLLLFTGIFLTFKTRFVQVRFFLQGLKNTFGGIIKKEKTDGISPFAALATSLAAQLGTGNIVGAGSAIILGGPGAVFWMWFSAFFGMATAYSEAVLAQKTRKVTDSKDFTGGAAYYIKYAFSGKKGQYLAGVFSLFATVALGFTGVSVQSNSISSALNEALNIPAFISGIILTLAAGVLILKGTKAIARLSEKTVPCLAFLYTAACLTVIIMNIKYIPKAFYLIFSCAFSPEALFGGITGISIKTALTQGIKRGLFTNEAGMGSTPSAHALSDAKNPHYQGTLGMAGVFIDTFLLLTLTALAIISVLYTKSTPPDPTLSGSEAVTLAFSSVFGQKGAALFIAFSIMFFAFASILGWNLFGSSSAVFLFGKKSEKLYTVSSLIFVFLGCIFPGQLVWALTDLFNTLMVLTNIPALIKLSKEIQTEANFDKNC
ncbi:MAG: sodium:alanine symporter family protein [Clostridia bacterium]|nr:sodium:alanine symporter family protein [Clostridia bacterium]